MEALEKVLDISELQLKLLSENRIEDLLKSQSERDLILRQAAGGGVSPAPSEVPLIKSLAGRIAANDSILSLRIESELSGLRRRLAAIGGGKKALRAYTHR